MDRVGDDAYGRPAEHPLLRLSADVSVYAGLASGTELSTRKDSGVVRPCLDEPSFMASRRARSAFRGSTTPDRLPAVGRPDTAGRDIRRS